MKKSSLVLAVAMGIMLTSGAFAAEDDAIVNQAKELINQKKYKECEELLDKAVTTYPDSLRVKNALGQAKYQNGKLSEASSIFSQVLGKDAENNYAKTMLEKIRKEKLAASTPSASTNVAPAADGENLSNEDFSDSSKSSGAVTFKVSNELSKEEQENLAKQLYDEMIGLDKWATADFIRLHTKVIEKCPLTDKAQESCWRLSNLYMLGVEPAEYDNAIAVLEHLLKQYPDTPLMPDAKNRMLVVCQKIGEYDKVIKLYEELWQKDPEPETKTYMIRSLEFGNALAESGRKEEAAKWYNKVLEKDEGHNALEARAARRKLEELNQ